MISLTSGLPGAGKTLWTIAHVEALRKKENREVFFHGIKDLTLDWRPLEDPKKWYECPPGAIIVIDEAQYHFPTRGSGSPVPEHVARAATHRHHGHDVFLITQHPGKLDSSLRKDIEVHRHLMRKFGSTWATVHQWQGVRETCDKTRKDSIPTEWRYPKEVYTWYKSSEVHTHKLRVPPKLLLALLLPFFIIGGFMWIFRDRTPDQVQKPDTAQQLASANPFAMQAMGGPQKASQTVAEYLHDQTPRVPGLQHTAPVYDALTTPKTVPVPSACIQWTGKGCKCFTQAGTPYTTSTEICLQIVRSGIFLPFDPNPNANPAPTRETASPSTPGTRGPVPPLSTVGQNVLEPSAGG